jgi:hypothetical protein
MLKLNELSFMLKFNYTRIDTKILKVRIYS